jgi:hypothetical protein
MDRLVHSLFDLSLLVHSLKRRGTALPLTGLAIFLLACARVDAGEQKQPGPARKEQGTCRVGKTEIPRFLELP